MDLPFASHPDRQLFQRLATAAREPQRGAGSRGDAERGLEPDGGDALAQPAEEALRAAVAEQAALDFEQQRPRRLERNLRRELAGPGGDLLERPAGQGVVMERGPKHGEVSSRRDAGP